MDIPKVINQEEIRKIVIPFISAMNQESVLLVAISKQQKLYSSNIWNYFSDT
jgi:hypothetical protein